MSLQNKVKLIKVFSKKYKKSYNYNFNVVLLNLKLYIIHYI